MRVEQIEVRQVLKCLKEYRNEFQIVIYIRINPDDDPCYISCM